ncbi:MAG TPA: hypothetical protein VFT58_05445 [Nitrososphaera sp.]|nr:hypothetical protein [Nitrososphaera sp.]
MAPWADVLYAYDKEWWSKYHHTVRDFAGLKISQSEAVMDPAWGLHQIKVMRGNDRLLLGTFGEVGWGGNSGFHALNLAVQFGAKRVVLVGYDMHLDKGLHWHGRHGSGLCNPTRGNVARWRRVVDEAAPLLHEIGVEVLNASPTSALTAYRKVDFASLFDADAALAA